MRFTCFEIWFYININHFNINHFMIYIDINHDRDVNALHLLYDLVLNYIKILHLLIYSEFIRIYPFRLFELGSVQMKEASMSFTWKMYIGQLNTRK